MSERWDAADPWRDIVPPLHPAAWAAIPLALLVTLILFWIWTPLGWIGFLISIWGATLFREPPRVGPERAELAVSPIDGIVAEAGSAPPPAELGLEPGDRLCVVIVPGVWDSHVVRAPISGRINALTEGGVGRRNRQALLIEAEAGAIGLVQSAEGWGQWARCDAIEGQAVARGNRLGVILPMGQVELYLPLGSVAAVTVGQRMVAGETVLTASDTATARKPRVRKPKSSAAPDAGSEPPAEPEAPPAD